MTADEFKTWLDESGLTWEQAAEALGVNRSSIKNYRDRGGKAWLRVACMAVKKTPSLVAAKKVKKEV